MGGRGKGISVIAGANGGSGFCENEIGDAGVVHDEGFQPGAGFDDSEHAGIAEGFAVRDVEVFKF